MKETTVLTWNKPGDLSEFADIRPFDESNLNGNLPCPKCGLLRSSHGMLHFGGTMPQEPRMICPGEQFQTGVNTRIPEPVKSEGDRIVELATTTQPESMSVPETVLPSSVQRMRASQKALIQHIAAISPEFMKEADPNTVDVVEETQAADTAEATKPSLISLPTELTPEWISVLAGVHPNQPIVYEVEPAEVGAGYQITKYQNAPERLKLDSLSCGDMPRYQVDELRLRLQIKMGYQLIVNKFGVKDA